MAEREETKLQSFQDLLRNVTKGDNASMLDVELLAKELDSDTLQIGLVHPFGVSLASAQVPHFASDDVDVDTLPSAYLRTVFKMCIHISSN